MLAKKKVDYLCDQMPLPCVWLAMEMAAAIKDMIAATKANRRARGTRT